MSNSTTSPGLVSTWVSTVDSRGRTRLETRWVASAAPAQAAAPASAPRPLAAHAGHAA